MLSTVCGAARAAAVVWCLISVFFIHLSYGVLVANLAAYVPTFRNDLLELRTALLLAFVLSFPCLCPHKRRRFPLVLFPLTLAGCLERLLSSCPPSVS